MTERPILFSAPMVRAILAGTKTQTRRIVKWQFRESQPGYNTLFSGCEAGFYHSKLRRSGWVLRSRGHGGCWNDRTAPTFCRHGDIGDRLWVRESWCADRGNDDISPARLSSDETIVYAADGTHRGAPAFPGRKRASIHMPRWASRISLEITDVRVQRLGVISDEDARAEGVADREAYLRLWHEINGDTPLATWVWAISFRRVA